MKINWGTGIAIFYTLFAGTMIFQVIKSTKYDNSLVVNDYYEKDLNYQTHYEKLNNYQNNASELAIDYDKVEKELTFQFKDPTVDGTIHIFRPSTSKMDQVVDIQLDDNQLQVLSTAHLQEGLWRLKVDWNAEGKHFFKEEVIVF